ncbi:unnamed protein product [Prunus armeniaca]
MDIYIRRAKSNKFSENRDLLLLPQFLKRNPKPPFLSAVTSAPTPPQIRPCRRHRRTQELLRRRRPSCRRELLRLGRIFAAVVLSPPGTKSGN